MLCYTAMHHMTTILDKTGGRGGGRQIRVCEIMEAGGIGICKIIGVEKLGFGN